ncbi:MAG TPA: MurT ligase domain-containing protein [Erysipelotrichaceae bacterium]|nr:MurT ligase domain-containing protein [Erysipelotrichaceae bacterium]
MSQIRFYLTLFIVKSVIRFMKLLGFNATDTPGRIALILCPDIIGRIKLPNTVLAVTGTNGKTSTNNILSQVLRNSGYSVIDNAFGGNINSGIASCLIQHCDLKGVCDYDFACLEIDERSAGKIFPYLTPDYLICTNLQRDSMMRNANVEFIFSILDKYLPASTRLILNGDELNCCQLGKGRNKSRTFFRVDLQKDEVCRDNIIKDVTVCLECGSDIRWDFVRNHAIGQGHCVNCDFGSPECKYIMRRREDNKLFIETEGIVKQYPLVGFRIVDYYNQTAVVSLLKEVGLTDEVISAGLENTIIPKSRFEEFNINGKKIISILSKGMNAIAVSSSFDVIEKDKTKKSVLLFLDDARDAVKSSELISWIYDVDYEFLNDENIRQIIIGGKRSIDHKVRMLMADIEAEKISTSINVLNMVEHLDVKEIETIYLLFDVYNVPEYKRVSEKVKQLCQREVA